MDETCPQDEIGSESIAMAAWGWFRPLLGAIDNYLLVNPNYDDPLPTLKNTTTHESMVEFCQGRLVPDPKAAYAWANALLYGAIRTERWGAALWARQRILNTFTPEERCRYVKYSAMRIAAETPSPEAWLLLYEFLWTPAESRREWTCLAIAAARDGLIDVLRMMFRYPQTRYLVTDNFLLEYELYTAPIVTALRYRQWTAVDLLRQYDPDFYRLVSEELPRTLPITDFGIKWAHDQEYKTFVIQHPKRGPPEGRLLEDGKPGPMTLEEARHVDNLARVLTLSPALPKLSREQKARQMKRQYFKNLSFKKRN